MSTSSNSHISFSSTFTRNFHSGYPFDMLSVTYHSTIIIACGMRVGVESCIFASEWSATFLSLNMLLLSPFSTADGAGLGASYLYCCEYEVKGIVWSLRLWCFCFMATSLFFFTHLEPHCSSILPCLLMPKIPASWTVTTSKYLQIPMENILHQQTYCFMENEWGTISLTLVTCSP